MRPLFLATLLMFTTCTQYESHALATGSVTLDNEWRIFEPREPLYAQGVMAGLRFPAPAGYRIDHDNFVLVDTATNETIRFSGEVLTTRGRWVALSRSGVVGNPLHLETVYIAVPRGGLAPPESVRRIRVRSNRAVRLDSIMWTTIPDAL